MENPARLLDAFGPDNREAMKAILSRASEIAADQVDSMSYDLAMRAYNYWVAKAITASSWGEKYASAIKPPEPDGGGFSVAVDDSHPNAMFVDMMEHGVKSWSIKDALLKGRAAMRNKAETGSLFVSVPFPVRTPKSDSSKTLSRFSTEMPMDVYDVVKSGQKLPPEQTTQSRLSGLKRHGEALHSQYMTFRTVTEKTKGWQYPAKPATPVFPDVENFVQRMISDFLDNWIKGYIEDLRKEFQ